MKRLLLLLALVLAWAVPAQAQVTPVVYPPVFAPPAAACAGGEALSWNGTALVCVASGSGAVATDVIWNAAGDLVQGTGSDTAARLAIGTAGQILAVNAGATAAEWITGVPGSTELDDLGDPSGNGSIATLNTTHVWTSTLDAAGVFMTWLFSDTDLANATVGFSIDNNDSADADFTFARFRDDVDGTPRVVWSVSETVELTNVPWQAGTAGVNFSTANGVLTLLGSGDGADENLVLDFNTTANEIGVSSSTSAAIIDFGSINLEVPCTAYDATSWNASETVPCMDAIRDVLETFVTPDAAVATWLVTPSCANLVLAVTGETGTGGCVFADTPTLITPVLGVATATSIAFGADPADAGAIRLSNATSIAWEADAAGTDVTLTVNSSEQFVFSTALLSPTLVTPALGTPATGTLNLPFKMVFLAGNCQNATASSAGNLPTTLGAAGGCQGTTAASGDPAYGVATFVTGGNNTEWHGNFPLPADWTGAVDVRVNWVANSATGNDVVFQIKTGCRAATETITSVTLGNDAFTASTNGGTLVLNTATNSAIDTSTGGCAAGEHLFFVLDRDTDTSGDTLDVDAQVISIEFTYRRAVVIGG